MSKYIVTQDVADCIGCRACEIHCKDANNTAPGVFYCRIIEVASTEGPVPSIDFIYLSCFHCEGAWCIYNCPTGAMRCRDQDGIVYIDEETCIGCEVCITACPWAVPQRNPETGKVGKCDLCKDRIDEGLEPACVTKCTTGCLSFTTAVASSMEWQSSIKQLVLKKRG